MFSTKIRKETRTSSEKPVFAILLCLLLFRILIGIVFTVDPQNPWTQILVPYQMLTYLFIALLIWLEVKHLEIYNFNGITLIVWMVFRAVFWPSTRQGWFIVLEALFFSMVVIVLVIKLFIAGMNDKFKVSVKDVVWVIFGLAVGLGIGYSQIYIANIYPIKEIFQDSQPMMFVYSILYQLSNAAIDEEPLFRGFLWGYLRRRGWKDPIIWIFQALLFWISHINYWGRSSFWFTLPFLGLFLGLLAWRSRSVATSMAAHAGYNSWKLLATFFVNGG